MVEFGRIDGIVIKGCSLHKLQQCFNSCKFTLIFNISYIYKYYNTKISTLLLSI